MDIYDYVTQMKLFLEGQNDVWAKAQSSVSAVLVMRFRRAIVLNILQSKQFLAQFSSIQQIQYVEIAELHHDQWIHDPIENDLIVRPLYELICEEVQREAELWHQQKLAELEQQAPNVAELFRNGRGLSHVYWANVKRLLWERHQIEWKSPAEMNPWRIFD
ncbi:MAG: hypothetical protein KME45_05440 [Stenomitos rutilans HA7619-LM2]|jgi:hypothetical protein|nr:hypothetical protein [Stenomitos rutilans HA7619-LM2]